MISVFNDNLDSTLDYYPEDPISAEHNEIVAFTQTPVCGTDGESYASECEMRISACNNQQFVVVANKGDCGKCEIIPLSCEIISYK